MPTTKIQTIVDKQGNTILPRTRSAAITLSDGTTTLDQAIDNAIVLKGSVAAFINLPTENLRVGDLYYITTEEVYYFWNSTSWIPLNPDETDPIFTAWDKSTGISITESQISDLQTYLTSETDPIFIAWDKSTGISITESQISDFGNYQVADPNIVSDASYVHTDNNFTTTLKTKLDGIEEGATADQTAAEIKSAYESNNDTNAFTDAEQSKLASIESGAEVNIDYTASNGIALSESDFSLDSTYKPTFDGAIFNKPIQIHGLNVTEFTPFPYSMINARCDRDGYTQFYVQNANDGPNASADMVLYNDLSDNESFLLDLGLNSSGFSSEDYPLFTSNSAYIYTGSDGTVENPSDLFIGTSSPNSDIVFFSGGFDLTNEVMRIGSDGSITIADSESSGQEFTVNGAATFNGTTEFTNTVILSGSPITDLEAATKYYVDSVAQGLSIKDSVVAGTIDTLANLTGGTIVYNNGTNGDGATLTISVAGTYNFLDSEVWDGYNNLSTEMRVLVKQQANPIQNGIYEITSSSVLTRTSDFNSDATIEPGSFVFVANGNTIAGTSWVLSTEVTNVGTDPINIQQFGGGASYSAGTNIDITNNVVSVSGTIAATKGGTGTSTVTTGDLLYGSSTNNWSKLTLGTAYKSLVVNASGTQLEWNSVALNTAAVSGTLPISNGGTGATTAAGALSNLNAASETFAIAMAIALS